MMNNKVCLITGGTSGIGMCTALAMKSAGYTVYEISRRQKGIDGIAISLPTSRRKQKSGMQ